ncbi:LOW QUALITY PROTEIN: hypothetical protein JCM24511_03736 [Saitozyma sp. JCM 24511]|nr:LOW QUALITY PROTEIN: hypothetical protein JCM24511_03736 [Saitozyma sp. JCM 24511]
MSPQLHIIGILVEQSPEKIGEIKSAFETVHYYPERDGPAPVDALRECEIIMCRWSTLDSFTLKDVPNLKVIQLTSVSKLTETAGVNAALTQKLYQDPGAFKQIQLCTASSGSSRKVCILTFAGMHVKTIPQYIIGQIITGNAIVGEKRWPAKEELFVTTLDHRSGRPDKSICGKTAGMLGYGHIAREAARVLKAMNVNIIAANSRGCRQTDDGCLLWLRGLVSQSQYILDGTGDKEGIIPTAYYRTDDPDSFEEFLSKSDILICSLPSTRATEWLLTKARLSCLPTGAVLMNAEGISFAAYRILLTEADDLISVLDAPNGLWGAVLDVTDPEPPPDGHPLFSHPRIIVTPHTSGEFDGYYDAATDLMLAQVRNIRAGGKPWNLVDPERGY